VAVVKRKKNRKGETESAAHALEKIEGQGDALAEWIGENPMIILGTAGALLVAAAIYGFSTSVAEDSRSQASSTLAEAKAEYRRAMGALPESLEIPEPANPEIAKSARTESLARFLEIADEFDDGFTESLALLEAGILQSELGDIDQAVSTWKRAVGGLDPGSSMRAILLGRIALGQEQLGDFAAAAASYAEAAEISAYPLRYNALIQAARCHAEAGDADAAIAAYERVALESPDLQIPDHTEAMLLELKASRAL
jgi:tetratricopeptide (TPR) repeat protein